MKWEGRSESGNVEDRGRRETSRDCYAGIWGAHAAQKGLLEPGDVEEGLHGRRRNRRRSPQRQAQGRVVPESFTHGSSSQRVSWFRRGLERGDPAACDTFATR